MSRILIPFCLLCTLLTFTACGGGKNPPPPAAEDALEYEESAEMDDNAIAAGSADAEQADEPPITPSSILQTLKITDKVRVGEAVKVELVHQEIPQGMDIVFRWWVNDIEIADQDSDTLPPAFFRPKDWLFCMAELLDDSDNMVQSLRSNRISVPALPPKTMLDPVPSFSVPGEFRYQIRAVDPNEPPDSGKQTLSYELAEPQSENIVIDRDSGMLSWMIDAETAQRLNGKQTISFHIFSSWGTDVTGSITLNFRQSNPEENPKPPVEENPEETEEQNEEETDNTP